jgi:hypothetical protein
MNTVRKKCGYTLQKPLGPHLPSAEGGLAFFQERGGAFFKIFRAESPAESIYFHFLTCPI